MLKQEAERRLTEWETTGGGLVASSLAHAGVFSRRAWETRRADHVLRYHGDDDLIRVKLNIDTSLYFDDAAKRLANPVLPHSEGEVVLTSADPNVHLRTS